ncbi:hypothetical protein Neosp_011057, partial [[Neocosmospora] mangrovei]
TRYSGGDGDGDDGGINWQRTGRCIPDNNDPRVLAVTRATTGRALPPRTPLTSKLEYCPDGNMMLLVGPKQKKIQISSHSLCKTSPVFKTMLTSNLEEGKTFREIKGAPAEIKLPDDYPEMVYNAFSALYGGDEMASRLSPDQVYDVAVLANKYCMIPLP